MFKIDKGIPVAPRRGSRASIYPFDDMDVGDSFLVPFETKAAKAVHAAAQVARRRLGRTFAVRAVAEGTRVWRID
jgi:hypothetical protein